MLVLVELKFLWKEENKRLGARRESTRDNSSHIWHWAGIEPRPHCAPLVNNSVASQLLQALNFIGEDRVAALLF